MTEKVHKKVARSVLRWHGGKWLLAPWIISHFPSHKVYVEPFGGAASVLLQKERSKSEVYNDIDGEAVNLFSVLRGPRAAELVEAVRLTPFSRVEFDQAFEPAEDAVERARRLLIRTFQGFGTNGHARRTGWRSKGYRAGTLPQHCWATQAEPLEAAVQRLKGVVIECDDALAVMTRYDEPDALFYVDPPYVAASRDAGRDYTHEMTDDDHRRLRGGLRMLEGMVIVSGYPCALYDQELFSDWTRVERAALADGARKRTEVLWLNPACARALGHGPLFETPEARP